VSVEAAAAVACHLLHLLPQQQQLLRVLLLQ
jgi:hypothetical protein